MQQLALSATVPVEIEGTEIMANVSGRFWASSTVGNEPAEPVELEWSITGFTNGPEKPDAERWLHDLLCGSEHFKGRAVEALEEAAELEAARQDAAREDAIDAAALEIRMAGHA